MDCTSIGELALLQAMDMAESQEDLEGVEVKINEFVIRTNFLDYDKGAVEIPEDLLAGESAAKSDADKEKAEAALTDALKSKENAEKAAGDLTEEEVLDMLSNMSDEELAEMLEGLSEEEIQELLDALQ